MDDKQKPKLRLAKQRERTIPSHVRNPYAGESAVAGEAQSRHSEPPSLTTSFVSRPGETIKYDGSGSGLFKIYARNVVMSLLTLGLYTFYGKVDLQAYHSLHTRVYGRRLRFHATGSRKLRAFMIALIVLGAFLAGGWFLTTYLFSSLSSDHPWLHGYRLFFLFFIFSVCLWMLAPLIRVGKRRFLLAYTSWNNIHFHFKGSVAGLYGLYLLDGIFILFSLGLFYPWHQTRVKGYLTRNSCLGTTAFQYEGSGGELWKLEVVGYILNSLTFGLHAPWLWAKRKRFHIENTSFQGRSFQCNLTGWDAISGIGGGSLLVLCTLGFGFPWAVVRWKRILLGSVRIPGSIQWATLEGVQTENSGVAEALGDAGEFLEQLGDIFG